jgi:4-amino-4-deoxy-L-arabinose transferase-like glycosyltransferase
MLARLRGWLDAARRHPHRTVAALAGFAFVVGGAVAVHTGSTLGYSDEQDYVELARNLADGLGFSANGRTPTAFRPPAWPSAIAVVDFFGGGIVANRFVGLAFFSATVVALYALVKRIAGSDAGLLAATLLTCYPLSLYTATTLYPESLATLLVTTGMLAAVIADTAEVPSARVGWAAAAGLCFGLLGLTAPAYLVVAAIVVVWLLWRHWSLRRVGFLALPLVVVLAIPLFGWGLRNEARLGSFIPVSTNGGLNLLLGNNPNATPTTGVDADITEYIETVGRRGYDEVEIDRYYREQALDWITANPGSAAVLYVGKLANFFNYRSNVVSDSQQSGLTDALGALTYYPLLLLFVVRLAMFRRVPLVRGEGLLALSYLGYAVTAAVFFTRIRFRVPVDQLMIGVVASGAVGWYRLRAGNHATVEGEPVSSV